MMPVPKQPNKAKTAGASAPAPAAPVAAPAVEPAADAGRAAVIAELIRGGMSYADAQAAVGDEQPAPAPAAAAKPKTKDLGKDPGADEEIDPDSIPDPAEELEVFEVDHTPAEGYTMLETLYLLRKDLETSRKKRRFKVTFELEQRVFDWLLYATIIEAHMRKRADLTIEDFINIKIKELKAADPTQGGRRDPSTSGPKDNYNPATGKWN